MKYKSIKRFFLYVLIGATSLFIISCKQDDQVVSKKITVGVLLGFSGTGSQNAIETKAALDICLEDVNAYVQRNGLDATVELYYEDTKSDTTEAKIKAQTPYR